MKEDRMNIVWKTVHQRSFMFEKEVNIVKRICLEKSCLLETRWNKIKGQKCKGITERRLLSMKRLNENI
jgi:hypothetical protein